MKPLLLALLLPLSILAQEVEPVISKDYLNLIKDSSQPKKFLIDTTNNVGNAFLKLSGNYNGYSIKRIKIKNGYLKIQPASYRALLVSGSFNSTVEVKKINRLPALQNQFVQGRSQNGVLSWQGPETGEFFSYGPDINTVEFDGSNYEYDKNGKLVAFGSGNGQKANIYNNSIFRTAGLLSQSFMVQGKYLVSGKQYLTRINLGQSRENTFIKDNKNSSQDFLALFEGTIKWLNVSATYSNLSDRFSNSNRNSFLNRVYQNSILTPISFDNAQGNIIGSIQRSYSNTADNPYFLLENNNSFFQSHRLGSLVLEKKQSRLRFRIAQSAEKLKENSNEGYKPGTAFFPNGIIVNRKKTDANYFFNANATYDVEYDNYHFRSTASANYIYGNTRSDIDYPTAVYNYQRSSHDFALNFLTSYNLHDLDAGLKLENKFYASNTVLTKDFFLPAISAYVRFNNIFNSNYLSARLVTSFSHFNSELPISSSFSQNSLVKYSTEQALQYFPATEVPGFDKLSPIRHKEWSGRVEFNYKNKISLEAEVFKHNIIDDIFSVYENGSFNLKNIASHQNKGFELILNYNSYAKKISTGNSLSFFANRNIVTQVKQGYNSIPIAGFANVNKEIIKGEPLGVIVGSKYLRDANNNLIIGSDGFPLVSNISSIIGDPTPDFVMKLTDNLSWKGFSLNVDWEWKKGGDIWNGTQAVLDYYGRSQTSALLRNTTNYIFQGVLPDGHANSIPVNFYDLNLPFEKNRWVRYGFSGVAEEYVQKGDYLRINNVGLSYKLTIRKYIQSLAFTLYANNIIVWTAYKGEDPNQLLYDQPNTNGLDLFNLPSVKIVGFNVSIQF